MAWYKVGSVALTNGSTAVVGTGTDWITGAAVGEAIIAPDGRIYEIAAIASATTLTITPAYLGTNVSGAAYTIAPTQAYIRDLAAEVAELVNQYATVANGVGQGKFPDGTLASPGVRFSADENTGLRRLSSDTMALVAGGVDIVTISPSGISAASLTADLALKLNAANPSYTGTLTGGTGVVNIGSGQFVKDASGNVGLGTATPDYPIDLRSGVSNAIRVGSSSGGFGTKVAWDTATGKGSIGTLGAYPLSFKINDVDVGKFDTSGNLTLSAGTGWFKTDGGDTGITLGANQGGGASLKYNSNGNLDITPRSGFNTVVTAGNLGLGVTPSAWDAGKTAIELANGASFSQSNGYAQVANNAYLTASGWVYKASAQASLAAQYQGQHQWFTAPSGTAGNPITFTQAMTLDADSNLSITGAGLTLAKIKGGAGTNQGASYYVTSANSSATLAAFGDTASFVGGTPDQAVGVFAGSGLPLKFYSNGVERGQFDVSGHLTPNGDNTQTNGSGAKRWSVIYAGTGTINTSDAREKTAVRSMAADEIEAAKALSKEVGVYQFLDSVAIKGDKARHHIGMTVQRAIEIMEAHGLNPFAYGFICYDKWDEETKEHPAVEARAAVKAKDAVLDDDGNVIEPAVEAQPAIEAKDAWTEVTQKAGDRYSFRYDQLTLFIAKGIHARLEALEAA